MKKQVMMIVIRINMMYDAENEIENMKKIELISSKFRFVALKLAVPEFCRSGKADMHESFRKTKGIQTTEIIFAIRPRSDRRTTSRKEQGTVRTHHIRGHQDNSPSYPLFSYLVPRNPT